MSDVTIKYKGQSIATMDASGTKTLNTQGKYCEANIGVEYVKPSGGTPAIAIVDTPDSHGGVVREITALDISDSTLETADQLAQGITGYNKDGVKLTGTGSGGGTISTSADAIRAYLESNGFVCSEFAVQTPESGDYISVPHSLGRVPDMVFAFNKDLHIEAGASGYQMGCASNGNYGADNNNNRTYQCVGQTISGSLIYTDCLKNFPLSIARTLYNFCQSASDTNVVIRNGNSANTHMIGTTWILAVK